MLQAQYLRLTGRVTYTSNYSQLLVLSSQSRDRVKMTSEGTWLINTGQINIMMNICRTLNMHFKGRWLLNKAGQANTTCTEVQSSTGLHTALHIYNITFVLASALACINNRAAVIGQISCYVINIVLILCGYTVPTIRGGMGRLSV